ncbi:MAG: CAP domain-containing protein [Myxococcales bacterium]|nr:CAP domain-containing protein [Myxococcales bacterium]
MTRSVLAALIVMTMTLACAAQAPATTEVARRQGGGTVVLPSAIAQRVHQEVNRVRQRHRLKPLRWDGRLSVVAHGHSRDMLRRDYFAHTAPGGADFSKRYSRANYVCRVPLTSRSYLTGGENLALTHHNARFIVYSDGRKQPAGFRSPAEVARRVVVGWLNSPGHRANLLKPHWRQEGIGVAIGADGRIWVTQNFC